MKARDVFLGLTIIGVYLYFTRRSGADVLITPALPPVLDITDPREKKVMEYCDIIMAEGVSQMVEPAVIAAIVDRESKGVSNVKTWEANVSDYSYGLMQIRSATAAMMGFKGEFNKLLEADINIFWGTKYLRSRWEKYGPSWFKSIAAYNAGAPKYSDQNQTRFINQAYVDYVTSKVPIYRSYFKILFHDYAKVVNPAMDIFDPSMFWGTYV